MYESPRGPDWEKAPAGARRATTGPTAAGALKGQMRGRYSIRVNDQYRVTFRWENGHAFEVAVEDYH